MNRTLSGGKASIPAENESAPATSAQILRQLAVIIVFVAVWSGLLVGYLVLTGSSEETPTAPASPETAQVSFSEDILPVFETRCQGCHGSGRAEVGLRLASYADVMAGSRNGPVVVPGSASTSYLINLLLSGQMPLGSPKLPDSEIQTIIDWINAGALDN